MHAKRTYAITNEVLEQIKFVLAYPTVFIVPVYTVRLNYGTGRQTNYIWSIETCETAVTVTVRCVYSQFATYSTQGLFGVRQMYK
jgi:hypothetical protein